MRVLEAPINPQWPEFGAVGDGSTATDGEALQAAIERAQRAATFGGPGYGGGEVYIPPGSYLADDGLVVDATAPVTIRGAGRKTTRIKRDNGTATLLHVEGSATARATVTLSSLELFGADTAGELLFLDRVNDAMVDDIGISRSSVTGLHAKQLFNSHLDNIWVGQCGNGEDDPAVLFDAYDEHQGACNTVNCSNWELEANNGVDLRLDGTTANNAAATIIQFTNVKMEAGQGAFPYVDLPFAMGVTFANLIISMGDARSGVLIRQNGSELMGTGANFFSNVGLDIRQVPGTAHAVEHGRGAMNFANVGLAATSGLTAIFHVLEDVPVGGFRLANVAINPGAYTRVVDDERDLRERFFPIYGAATYDPPSIANGVQVPTNVTVTGAAVGDPVDVAFSQPLQGMIMWGEVSAANTVTVYLRNSTGNPVNLDSGTLTAQVWK